MNKMEIAREFSAVIEKLEALAEEALYHPVTTDYIEGKIVAFEAAIELLKRQANSLLN